MGSARGAAWQALRRWWPSAATRASSPVTAFSARRLLVVDDNPRLVELFRTACEEARMPAAIAAAPSGAEALARLRSLVAQGQPLPEVLVVDLHMPGMSGIDLIDQIRADARLAALPIAVLTTSHTPADAARCAALGVRHFLVKPSRFHEFVALVRTVVQDGTGAVAAAAAAP